MRNLSQDEYSQSLKGSRLDRLMEHVVDKRIFYFFLSIVVLLATSSQIANMAFNGDLKVMFDKNDPYFKRLEILDDTYLQSKYLVFLIDPSFHIELDRIETSSKPNNSTSPDLTKGSIFSYNNIQLIEKLTNDIWQLPAVIRVDSLSNYPRISVDGDSIEVNPLIDDASSMSSEALKEIKYFSENEAQLRGRYISRDASKASIIATIALPEDGFAATLALNDAASALIEKYESEYPGLTIHMNGDIALEKAMIDITVDDITRVNPAVFVVIFSLLGLFLRSVAAIAATGGVVLIATGVSTGLNVILGFEMNPITMMAPAIIMVLAVADSVHVLTLYSIRTGEGYSPKKAMIDSLQKNVKPIFWTSVTTAVGFLGMNFGDSPPFRDMGNMAAIGVFIAFLATLFMLPTIALKFPNKKSQSPTLVVNFLAKLSTHVLKYNTFILIGLMLLTVGLAWNIPSMKINDDIAEYFDETLPIQQSIEFARHHFDGIQYVVYSLDSEGPGGINEPAFINKVDLFSGWLRQQPEVSSVQSYADLIKDIHSKMSDKDDSTLIPNDRKLIAQYQLLYELSLPQGADLSRDINSDRSSIRLLVNMDETDNHMLMEFEKRADKWLGTNEPSFRELPSSQLLIFAHMGTNIILSMVDGSLFTLIFITIMMVIGLRSIKFGIMSIIPNLFPPIVVFGIWALVVGEVNHAAAMTFSICLGLVVDDTIHMLSKYLDARRSGKTQPEAITDMFINSGTAIVITSLTLTAGVLLLSLSHFTVNDTISLMLAGIIMMALFFDLLLLPALLVLFDRVEASDISADEITI